MKKSKFFYVLLTLMAFLFAFSVNAQDCYLAGTMNGWSTNSTKLNKNGGQYELVLKLDKDVEFKVVYNGNWYGFDKIKNGGDLVSNNGGNIKTKTKNCYGIYFKPDNNGEIYLTHADNCPEPFSFWGFDILYQEGTTKKWASTKSTANRWDGNFILTSTDNEVFDLGIVKRGTKFIGFRAYTNDNGSDVQGMNVIWSDVDVNAAAIEGGNYGKWSNDGTKAGASGGTDEVWDVTDRSSKFMGYENGEYSFNLNFELKVNGNDKTLVRTIKIKYTINEFELTADLNGPCYVGDQVKLTVEGGTSPYTWQTSSDGVSWNTLSGVTGTTYTHKVADKIYFRVKDSDSKTTGMVELTPSIKCDPNHTITVFKETFGTLSSVDARTSYSKSNVPVEGHSEITYSARIPSYTVSTVECGAMTDAGRYAVLANPRNAGCGTDIAQDTKNCGCYNSSERWYRDTEDHTGDTNGGMLMYNCADGTKTTPDVLYECTINGICARTYINFSAFVTCANTGRSGNIPIEAEFKLYSGTTATGIPLSIIPVKNIGLNTTWKEISAMFNSGIATTVTIQLVNKAADGQGNDLLLDDITLSICTPEASLVCSDGVTTEKTIFAGESEELTSYIMSGIMEDPYYLWLTSEDNNADIKEWDVVDNPAKTVLSVSPTKTTYYKVIISNTKEEAEAVYKKETSTACGMHAITNTVTINIAALPISFTTHPSDVIVCEGSEATFSVVATNADNYQWQKSTNNVAWIDIEGETATSYVIRETTKNDDKTYYRVKATNTYGTVAYSNSAKLTVNSKATISNITAPSAICAGSALALPTLNITNNGSTVTNGKWYLDGSVYTEGTAVEYNKNGKTLQYKATSSCGGAIQSNAVSITVNDKATISNITAPSAICAGSALTLPTLNITNNGSTVTNGKWYLDGSVYTEGTAVEYNKNGKTLQYKATSSCGGAIQSNAVAITVNDKPTITINNTPEDLYCAGMQYTLPNVSVNYNGSDKKPEVEGWYLDGKKLPSNKVTFKLENVGKKLVYKASNTCGETEREFISSLVVEDCADLVLVYSLDKSDYCAGDEAVLTAIIKNNGTTDLSDVKLNQTWSRAQDNVTTTQTVGTYANNIWSIPTLAKGEDATLTIKFTANESEEFKMHVTAANGVTYSSYDASVAKATTNLVVKEISSNVVANNYISCPTDGAEFPITDLVTSNKDQLSVMGKNESTGEYYALTAVPMVNPSVQTASTTYYITNTENGKCESTTPTPITIEVYKPVSASISAPTEICSGKNSAVEISLDGEAPYVVVYNNGTSDVTLDNITTSTITINDALYTTTTYSLVSVTDENGCEAPISSDDKATINVNELPTIASVEIEDDDDYICQGSTTQLIVTFTGTPDFSFNVNGNPYTHNSNIFKLEISEDGNYVVSNLVDAKCSSSVDSQASAVLYVEDIPVVTVSPTSAELDCNTEEITLTASGAHSYSWTDNKNSAPTSGDKLVAKRTDTGTTIYTVVGTSQHGCASDEVSVTVKENFVAPTVELKPQLQPNGEPWPTELTCRMKRIPVVADTENSSVDIVKYEWSNGLSTTEYTELSTKGKHTVTVTGKNGCTATSSIEITENVVNPILSVEHIGSRSKKETTVLNCFNQYNYVTPSVSNVSEIGGSIEYFWYKNGREYFYGDYLEISEAGTYMILANGANDCEATYTLVLTEDKERPEAEIVASAEMVTCSTPEVNLTVKTDVDCNYFWTGIVGEDAEKQTIKVEEGGTYQVFVQSNVNGCITTLDYQIDEETDLPVVEITPSEDKVTCKPNTLTASGAKTYVWSTGDTTESTQVTEGGLYTVEGTNEYGCKATAEIELEADQLIPAISLTSDTTTVTCRKETVLITAEVTNNDGARTYTYVWTQDGNSTSVTASTFDAQTAATYKVTITDETNACFAEESIKINENKELPSISTQSLAAVCLPATVDIADAVTSTNADAIKYYTDESATNELLDTNIEAAEGAKYYVVGYEMDNNGCVTDPVEIKVNVKPVSSAPVVKNYDECAIEGYKTLSSLVTSDNTKLVFFADETSTEPIENKFDASAENTTTSYWVSNTAANSCESERTEIVVNITGFVDFSVEASDTRLPAGQELTLTITPLSDTPVEQYVWYRGEEQIKASDELELTEQLYLNEKYIVQAVGRCNSPKKEVDVEAIWPTAFTPHNGNGKNDSFADGMNIIVFNRFYTKIYEGPDGWDGSINGAMNDGKETAVPGVYYYSVLLPNGQVKKGTIEIIKID